MDLSGCTNLVEQWQSQRLIPLLTATGKTVEEVLATGCWECHDWTNCPMHVVFGVTEIAKVPKEWQKDASIFVNLFDGKCLVKPAV